MSVSLLRKREGKKSWKKDENQLINIWGKKSMYVSKKNREAKNIFKKENACLSITIVLSKSEKPKWNSYQEW